MKNFNLKNIETPLTWLLSIILIIVFVYNGWNYQKNLSIPFECYETDLTWKTENWNYLVRCNENNINQLEHIDTLDCIDSNFFFQDSSEKFHHEEIIEYSPKLEVVKSIAKEEVIELISEEDIIESISEEEVDYIEEEIIDSVYLKDIKRIQEEPIKPVLKDFKNSTEYQKALRKYYKAIE